MPEVITYYLNALYKMFKVSRGYCPDDSGYIMEMVATRDEFCFRCLLPKELISDFDFERCRDLGQDHLLDYLVHHINFAVIDDYVVPAFYESLALEGRLNEPGLRDWTQYEFNLSKVPVPTFESPEPEKEGQKESSPKIVEQSS